MRMHLEDNSCVWLLLWKHKLLIIMKMRGLKRFFLKKEKALNKTSNRTSLNSMCGNKLPSGKLLQLTSFTINTTRHAHNMLHINDQRATNIYGFLKKAQFMLYFLMRLLIFQVSKKQKRMFLLFNQGAVVLSCRWI